MSDSSWVQKSVKFCYNSLVRPFLPTRIAAHNGVPVRSVKIFDQTISFPDYERGLIDAIRTYGQPGDTIVQVGGGLGVSAVASARRVEPSGEVIVYEGSREYVQKVHETLSLNGVEELVTVTQAVVGEARDLWGDATETKTVSPTTLPDCNMLVLDCEGAEQMILDVLEIRPKTLVVESHGLFNSPTEDVKEQIQELGYDIESVEPELPEDDVYVVVGRKCE